MKSVRQYLDYRIYLHDYYECKRQEDGFFSYRYMAGKVDMDHGYLVKLLQQKVHLAEGHIQPFLTFCGLSGRDAEYFKTLIHFNKSKQPDETSLLFEKLMELAGVDSHPVAREQFAYYTTWYYSAVRALLGHMDFRGDFKELARNLNPKITEKQAREAVRLLESLKLIRKEGAGYKPTNTLVTTGPGLQAAAVRKFQLEMMHLAEKSLESHPKEQRDISSVTLSIDIDDLQEVRDRIAAFRQSLMNLASKTPKANSVFQLNVQMFPLSQIKGTEP